MDTITHGIAGALIGKALFRGEDMLAPRPLTRGRVITWSLMLGAIFPDSDTLRDIFSHNELLVITWHRSVTHSLVCLPIFALALAALTRSFVRWRKWDVQGEMPSFAVLTGIYAIGILSHILLDLATSFGTIIWAPLKWSRPAWDLLFIIDFTFTAILLVPQILAWVYAKRSGLQQRAFLTGLSFVVATVAVAGFANLVGTPISIAAIVSASLILLLLVTLPRIRGWGLQVRYSSWNLAGFFAALAYIALAFFAHRTALARVKDFAAIDHLEVQSMGALPLPPSLLHWDGLIRVPRGVYEIRMDLTGEPTSAQAAVTNADGFPAITHSYYPDAAPNSYIEAAKRLPEVQKVLWFDRFPVTRFRKEGNEAIVEIVDLRFPRFRPNRSATAFTYRVRFAADGTVLSQGWVSR
jgi:membrane-bound metal-dependent hydrolase YbcI (DUF457 family)